MTSYKLLNAIKSNVNLNPIELKITKTIKYICIKAL
jgi:hypothetical protein